MKQFNLAAALIFGLATPLFIQSIAPLLSRSREGDI